MLRTIDLSSLGAEARGKFIQEVQEILRDVATFSPLGADTVKNLHAQNQKLVHRYSGHVKHGPAAGEISVLGALTNEHARLKTLVCADSIPSKTRLHCMQQQLGKRKGQPITASSSAKKLTLAKMFCVS